MESSNTLPRATVRETAAFLVEVFLPTVAKGPIIRRPRAVALAGRLGLDERAVRRVKSSPANTRPARCCCACPCADRQ
ncbi:hypothetical protein OL239_11695 [Arthrobacter sp. ATA002]|uniref:hypothetical protein n=1 Tax=Arthrobacter sp. ATA002 TaxID=2991715 RepID=UPI0022A6AD43|nr:hypothetical protein [Arthrobacter sp. ATA002]WAP50687.1 hypothetical protein OL239_11695 [Arthrobacter sp. ATA002]